MSLLTLFPAEESQDLAQEPWTITYAGSYPGEVNASTTVVRPSRCRTGVTRLREGVETGETERPGMRKTDGQTGQGPSRACRDGPRETVNGIGAPGWAPRVLLFFSTYFTYATRVRRREEQVRWNRTPAADASEARLNEPSPSVDSTPVPNSQTLGRGKHGALVRREGQGAGRSGRVKGRSPPSGGPPPRLGPDPPRFGWAADAVAETSTSRKPLRQPAPSRVPRALPRGPPAWLPASVASCLRGRVRLRVSSRAGGSVCVTVSVFVPVCVCVRVSARVGGRSDGRTSGRGPRARPAIHAAEADAETHASAFHLPRPGRKPAGALTVEEVGRAGSSAAGGGGAGAPRDPRAYDPLPRGYVSSPEQRTIGPPSPSVRGASGTRQGPSLALSPNPRLGDAGRLRPRAETRRSGEASDFGDSL